MSNDNCGYCVALLAPPYEITMYEASVQASWLTIIDEALFQRMSTGAGGEFVGIFSADYSQLEEYRRKFFAKNQGSVTKETALARIRKGVPKNAAEFVDCMKVCGEGDDLIWTIVAEAGRYVNVWMKWRPTPQAPGKLQSSTVVGAVSDQDGAAQGKIFAAGTSFAMMDEATVVFTRDEEDWGYPALVASLNVSGIARSVELPEKRRPRAITEFRVRTRTGTHKFAGTDGRVNLNIGDCVYRLDNQLNNFERGKEDTFLLPAWNGATDLEIRGMRATIANVDYKKKHQGWLCDELYFAHRIEDQWIERGPYSPGWLDETFGEKVGRFEFII